MASAETINVSPSIHPSFSIPGLSQESAEETNKFLQENHTKHNIFFETQIGLHNHIVHHLLTAYSLGATPSQLKQAYTGNANYQLAPPPAKRQPHDLTDLAAFEAAEGKKSSYTDFLAFFESYIAEHGWQHSLEEFIFKGDERANRLLRKLGAGILHSLIQLGFGIEFEQPAIIAESLAEAAVHADELEPYLKAVDAKVAKEEKHDSEHLSKLYEELRANRKIVGSTTYENAFAFGQDIFNNAKDEMVSIAARYRVSEDELEERMKEAVNVNAFITASLQMPPHYPKFDFVLIHSHNATIFLPAFLKHLKPAHFARLFETEVRTDMLLFASSGARDIPKPGVDHVLALAPSSHHAIGVTNGANGTAENGTALKGVGGKSWEQLYEQTNNKDDDGHVIKCLRAMKHAEVLAGTQTKFQEPLRKEDILPVTQVWMKGTEGEQNAAGRGQLWTRGAGFKEAWKGLPSVEEVLEKKGREM